MGAVKGLLSTSNADANDLVGEYQDTIFVRNSRGYNAGTTLFGLMSKLENEAADNLEYNWFERDPIKKTVYSNAGLAGATSFFFGTAAATQAGDANPYLTTGTVLRSDLTGEYMVLGAVPNDVITAVPVTRLAYNGIAATAVVAAQSWTIITVGKAEGADPVAAAYENPNTIWNYIQTFNSTVEVTNAFKGSVLRSDIAGPLQDRRIQALERISRDIEFAYFFGANALTVGAAATPSANNFGTTAVRYTGGILSSLYAAGLANTTTSLPVDAVTGNCLTGKTAGSTSIGNFNLWLQTFMGYGSDCKLAFCGPKAYAAISSYANSGSSGYRIMQNETVYGMNISVINTPFGELSLTQHPLFREAVGQQGTIFAVDLPLMVQKVYEKLFLEDNIQSNGNDSYKEQFRAKLGLKLKFPNAFGVAQNVTSITPI